MDNPQKRRKGRGIPPPSVPAPPQPLLRQPMPVGAPAPDDTSMRPPAPFIPPAPASPADAAPSSSDLAIIESPAVRFWTRACRLLLLLILVTVPLLYPLRLPDRAIEAIESHRTAWWYPIYIGQLYAFLNYGYSPLPLKESAFGILTAALVFCWFARLVVGAGMGSPPGGRKFDWAFYGPILALLAYGALSLLYTPTFYWSVTTFALLATGLLWLIVVTEMPKSPATVRLWFNGVLTAGAVVAAFAFLQDTDSRRVITGWLFVNIERLAQSEPTYLRLRMGSLIGHNIGVASFLMFSWFILIARMFQQGSWRRKALWLVLLILTGYVLAASQTRGIWLVLGALTPLHLIWLVRETRVRVDLKMVLGVILILLIILTLQIFPSERNPFYSPESPLLQRFTHFSPQHLLTETRLRIAACSIPLLAKRPLHGYGLGSFQYVFPPAQADYFAANPHTLLAPTPHRTVQAHSDWLQLIVELGLPGLLVVLGGLHLMLRRGWNAWQRLRGLNLRLELTAALMSVAGVMLHALADFPGHVVSTISPALFFLGVWASCGRIERGPTAAPPAPEAMKNERPGKSSTAALLALRGLALALALVVAAAVSAAFYVYLQASMHESLGTSFRVYYGDHAADPQMTYNRKRQILRQAMYELKKAHRLVPLDGQVVFRLGEVAALHGVLNVMDVLEARAEGTSVAKVRELVRGQEADLLLREAIARLTDCQTEVRYHEVYHYLGMAYENLYMLYGFEEDRQEAKKNYRLAVRYSPCFSRSLYRLFVLLQKDRPPNVEEMREVCRQIALYDPAMFERQFIQPVVKANERQDYQQVALKADVLLEVMPMRYEFWLYRIHALACLGRAKEAAFMLDEYARVFSNADPRFLATTKMEIAAGLGRWSEALAHAEAGLAFADLAFFHPYLFAGRGLALERLGRADEAKAVWAELDRLGQADARFFCAAANLFYYIASDRTRAYEYALKACRASDAIPAAIVRMAAELSFERGEAEAAVGLLERALQFDPEDPLSLALLRNAKP